MVKNKKTQTGLFVRIFAGFIDVVSLPFLILNPTNIYAQISFGFGTFLLLIGGLIE